MGVERRLATRRQRMALRARYPTCGMDADCDVPFDRCQIHHVDVWTDGGCTDLDRMCPGCDYYYHLVHEGGLDSYRTRRHAGNSTHPTATTMRPSATRAPSPSIDLSAGVRLRRLIIGSDRSGGRDEWIGDYGVIGDCHSMALVGRDGSIGGCSPAVPVRRRTHSLPGGERLIDGSRGRQHRQQVVADLEPLGFRLIHERAWRNSKAVGAERSAVTSWAWTPARSA